MSDKMSEVTSEKCQRAFGHASHKAMACLAPMVVYYENALFVPFVIVCVLLSRVQPSNMFRNSVLSGVG